MSQAHLAPILTDIPSQAQTKHYDPLTQTPQPSPLKIILSDQEKLRPVQD